MKTINHLLEIKNQKLEIEHRSWSYLARNLVFSSWIFAIIAVCFSVASLSANPLASPDQPGPYKVGFTQFQTNFVATVSGAVTAPRPTTIYVWYPCDASDPSCGLPPAGSPTYSITIYSSPNPSILLPSPLGVSQNASVAPGSFPLLTYASGGPSTGTRVDGEGTALSNFANNEFLASHGFIVASYFRNGGTPSICNNLLMNPREVIDFILTNNATAGALLEGHVDINKIGAIAASDGGNETYALGAGIAAPTGVGVPLLPDSRVKAILSHEGQNLSTSPGACGITQADKLNNAKPLLIMAGSPDRFQAYGLGAFNQYSNALPRILVKTMTKANNPYGLNAEHLSFGNTCYEIDRFREESLRLQQLSGQNPLVEPLTSLFPSDPTILDTGARLLAGQAKLYWNGPASIFRGRTFCNRVGTAFFNASLPHASSIWPLDADQNGYTDSPPLVTTPIPFASLGFVACPGAPLVPCISQEPMERLVDLYAVAFFKVVLAGDSRYAKYLTHEYSLSEPDADATTLGPIYTFDGFFSPVDNYPTSNSVKAGQSVPVRFSLGGDQGLAIFADGYPRSEWAGCGTAPTDPIEETATPGQSGLQYDPVSDEYSYIWKTEKAWKGTCRQLVLKLNDDQVILANFKFN